MVFSLQLPQLGPGSTVVNNPPASAGDIRDPSLILGWKDPQASLVAQLVKNLPAMWETWVQSLGWEDALEKGKATHSNILAWRIPWTVQSMGSQRIGHD